VIALGGNALAPAGEPATIANQFRHTRKSLGVVVELALTGWRLALVHGNGPQVGDELARNELARGRLEPLPLGVLVAGTAGWIGYMIQQSLQNALARLGSHREVVTLITQTLVDAGEARAALPSKPIGHALTDPEAERLRQAGESVGRDGTGRWRRLSPSPLPAGIVEVPLVRRLVNDGVIVVAAGGGGPPVYLDPGLGLEGVEAVVDKDRTAAVLAAELGSDVLLILTDVAGVHAGWGTPSARLIPRLSRTEAESLLDGRELGTGSMRPKVEAAVAFLRGGGRRAVIAHLDDGLAALAGMTGTTITGDG
jgi:carbamate kinase